MYLSSNVKFLRKRKNLSQEEMAIAIDSKRSVLNSYENNIASPPLEMAMRISDYFKISLDTLLRIDLIRLPEYKVGELERGLEDYMKGKYLRVIATTTNHDNVDNIEMVSEKASAGYTSGYSDIQFISELPQFSLPFLDKRKKYRSFQISGDSMLPIQDKTYVTCEYVEDWTSLKDGLCYVILTKEDGIVFKRVYNDIVKNKTLALVSNNPIYKPYEVKIEEVLEIWKYVMDHSKTLD
jgi:transcriptional regulator with XRE-family HTH domain